MAKKQKSGLYRTKVKIGVDAQGKPVNKWISGKTKRELELNKQAVIDFYITGVGLKDDMLFGTYASDWFKRIKSPKLSESSRDSYRSMLNKHVFPAFGNRNLRAITASDLQIWLNGFEDKSSTTIQLAQTVITSIFAAARADRLISTDPAAALQLPKASKKKERRSLTEEETEKMLHLIQHHEYGAYVACLYYLGVRPGEARGLMWEDFDFDSGVVHISRDIDFKAGAQPGDPKSDAAHRDIPVPDELKAALKPHSAPETGFLFTGRRSGQPWSKAKAERIWLILMESVGLVEPREQKKEWKQADIRARLTPTITPHYLRHNYITRCWEAGLDPVITMRIVGHADYRTTVNIYTHLQEKHLADAKKAMELLAVKKVAQKLHNETAGEGDMQKETLENALFSRVFAGTGDRIRTNDTPGMNQLFVVVGIDELLELQGKLRD